MKLYLIYLLLLSGLAQVSYAGMSSSGTGEIPTVAKNPWFIGDKPFGVCVDHAKDHFSLGETEAKKQIKKMLDDWVETLSQRPMYLYYKKSITLKYEFEDCKPTTDLKFMLGQYDEKLEKYHEEGYLGSLIAFAQQRGDFDFENHRAKGMIWFVPDIGPEDKVYKGKKLIPGFWSVQDVFWNVGLHELGHVFGFRHNNNRTGQLMNAQTPYDAVQYGGAAGMNLPKSSKQLLYTSWIQEKREVCGLLFSPDEIGSKFLRKMGMGTKTQTCVKILRNDKDWRKANDITMEFSQTDPKVKLFQLVGKFEPSFTEDVLGYYLGDKGKFLYSHTFISFKDRYRISGIIENEGMVREVFMRHSVYDSLSHFLVAGDEGRFIQFSFSARSFQ